MEEIVLRVLVVTLAAMLVIRSVTAVITCPYGCFCLSDTKVICNKGSLESIPDNLPTTVEELKFSRNPLPGLTSDMFRRWRKIRTLTLDDNAIRDIKPFAFRGLGSLHEISIQNNPLSELPQFSFAGLENVSLINLSKNQIQTINPYVFAGSRNLGIINLKENPVIRVEARAFSGLRNVHFIYLPFWVKVIESDAFYDMEGVGLLCLHSLDLHALRPFTFRGLRNVTQISIKESDLGVMREEAFSGLQNVGELRIISNKVDVLESLEVLQDSNVDRVIVSGNHFLHVTRQKPFRIHANHRSVVKENYVPCSCQLRWVLESPTALQEPLFSRHNLCVSPYALHGKPIDTVDLEQLSPCAAPQEYQGPENPEAASASVSTTTCSHFYVCALLVVFVWPW